MLTSASRITALHPKRYVCQCLTEPERRAAKAHPQARVRAALGSASSCPRRSGAARSSPSYGEWPQRCPLQGPQPAPIQDYSACESRRIRRRVNTVRHRTLRGFRPKAAPDMVRSAAQQQIKNLTVSRDDGRSSIRVGMRPRPSAVGIRWVLVRAGGLNHAVQRDVFDDRDLSHRVSFNLVSFAA